MQSDQYPFEDFDGHWIEEDEYLDPPPLWQVWLVWTVLGFGCLGVWIGILWALWKTVGAG
jgi:hypothetical protein